MAQPKLHAERIAVDPKIAVGKPVVRGTRVPVTLVLQVLAHDLAAAEVMEAYPRVTREDIKACLAYAQKPIEGEDIFPVELPYPTADSP